MPGLAAVMVVSHHRVIILIMGILMNKLAVVMVPDLGVHTESRHLSFAGVVEINV